MGALLSIEASRPLLDLDHKTYTCAGSHMLFHVNLEITEDGWTVAECPALPGCVSQGKNEHEALANIKEAIQAWLWAEDQKALRQTSFKPASQIVVAV